MGDKFKGVRGDNGLDYGMEDRKKWMDSRSIDWFGWWIDGEGSLGAGRIAEVDFWASAWVDSGAVCSPSGALVVLSTKIREKGREDV
jgi:hypothetical protein